MEKIVLTKEEFIYLYNLCDGKHINYDYIAMVPDVQQRLNSYKSACEEHLAQEEIIEEFWGEITVPPKTSKFLSPIWNGEYEAFIARIDANDYTGFAIHIHREETEYRAVTILNDCVEIISLKEEDLFQFISIFSPVQRIEGREIIILKSINNETMEATVDSLYLENNLLYRMMNDEKHEKCEKDIFQQILYLLVKGV